ncbi:MAG: hypothetical protein JRF33_14900 [Deltaproteobacteria bacterium]|nr:hypothetical protein [Deltaproteobacteria bacterium]
MVIAPLLIAIPLAAAFLIPLLDLVSKRAAKYVPPLVLLANLVLAGLLVPAALNEPIIVLLGGWSPPFCINLVVGPLGIMMTLLISFVSFLVSIYAAGYIKKGPTDRYHMLFLVLVAGATGVVLTGDIFNLFVFFEIVCISSYALTGYNRDKNGSEAAFKYLVQGTVGSTLILIAIALIYGLFGTLNMADIASRISSAEPAHLSVILALFITGFGVEAAIFPLNAWLPDAHSSAPSPISAILSGIAIKTGIYAIARTTYTLFNGGDFLLLLSTIGLVTLIVGEMLAYRQREDIKRMLAYSSIGQVGLIVFALGIATSSGLFGALFQLFNHAIAKSLLFLAVGYMIIKVGSNKLSSFDGLGKKMPLTCLLFAIAAFSLIGLPPFAGFISKLSIIYAAVETNNGVMFAFVVVVLLTTVVEAGYFFRLIQAFYFKGNKKPEKTDEAPFFALFPLITLAILIIVIGIYPQVVTRLLQGAAEELLNRADYIHQILGLK